jgi:hypothetical protein
MIYKIVLLGKLTILKITASDWPVYEKETGKETDRIANYGNPRLVRLSKYPVIPGLDEQGPVLRFPYPIDSNIKKTNH